ncbi:ferritin-like domain-containing protein [Alkaliphilus hydrothermalis]|uniref:Rubrerythrin n=1 Tax=Alkaliphilus hydrothermalis TaxID=1482730 RepID=A0ABS2NLM0_9FIRM|nr:ferritin-like domain-containing protein [Alkaliphilus hydrothermalis]MBM7613811.1 rubrerythrin [Alkaliphilus hydrothermalis]
MYHNNPYNGYTNPMMPYCPSMSGYQDQYTYPYNFPMALELIREAVSDERSDELFYDYLLGEAPTEEDQEMIRSIRDDERKHFALFRQLYYELTGMMLPPPPEGELTPPESYCMGLKQALRGELATVQKYRKILFAMQSRRHINMMTEIITDELRHADLYNLLYSKNECYEEELQEEMEEEEED